MEIKKIYRCLGILSILMGIGFFIYFTTLNDAPNENKIVDCYDKYDNKIIGQQCIEENSSGVPFYILFGIIPVFIGIAWMGFSFLMSSTEGLY